MKMVYETDENGVYTKTVKLEDGQGRNVNQLTTAPPELDEGQYAQWIGASWKVLDKYPTPPEPIPQSVSSRQGLQQLIIAGLDEQVDTAIEGISDTIQRKLTRAWFDKASEWERNNTQLINLGEALGLTSDQIDELFIEASKL